MSNYYRRQPRQQQKKVKPFDPYKGKPWWFRMFAAKFIQRGELDAEGEGQIILLNDEVGDIIAFIENLVNQAETRGRMRELQYWFFDRQTVTDPEIRIKISEHMSNLQNGLKNNWIKDT